MSLRIAAMFCWLAFSLPTWATPQYQGLNYDVYVKLDYETACQGGGVNAYYNLYLKPLPKVTVLDRENSIAIQQYPLEPALHGVIWYTNPTCVEPESIVMCRALEALAPITALSQQELQTWTHIKGVNGDWNGDGFQDLFIAGPSSPTSYNCPIQIKNNGLAVAPSFAVLTPSSALTAAYLFSRPELQNNKALFGRDINGDGSDDLVILSSASGAVPGYLVKADSNGKLFTDASEISAYVSEPDLGTGFFDPASVLPKTVGATAGSHSIGIDGSANYSIPLALPKAAGDIQPSLAFQYSSNSGNGNMGFGWQLTGTSRIHRCGKTEKQEGEFTAVDFDANDQLCLDGQRLLLKSGSHGVNGAEYRLENEVFIKVIAAGSSAGGMPDHFIVHSPDGSMMEYGNTDDSSIEANGSQTGQVLEWALNRAQDRWGNARVYHYSENTDAGYYNLDYIEYGGNGSSPHTNRVQLLYGDRGNGYYGYMKGALVSNPKVLTSVEVYEGDFKLRFYAMKYQVAPHNRLIYLTSITECSGANVCLYPTRFEWETPASGFNAPAGAWLVEGTANLYSDSTAGKHEHWADMNGDGRMDRVWKPSNKNGIWVALANSTGTGFDTPSEWLAKTSSYNLFSQGGSREIYADANGDGLPDFVWQPSNDDNNLYVALNTGSSLQTPSIWLAGTTALKLYFSVGAEAYGRHEAFVDMDADGLVDKVWRPNGEQDYYVALNTGSSFLTPDIWYSDVGSPKSYSYEGGRESWLDVTGDGLPDKVWVPTTAGGAANSNEIWVAKNNGEGFNAATQWLEKDSIEILSSYARWEGYADLNNDGLADRYWMPKNLSPKAFYVALSDGTQFLEPSVWLRDYSSANEDIYSRGGKSEYFMDVNDDGYTDRVWRPNDERQSIFVALSTGSGFMEPTEWLSESSAGYKVGSYYDVHETFVDVSGDGLPDRVWIPSNDANSIRVSLNLAKPSSELVKITNGFGHETRFSYAPLTDGSAYNKHAGIAVTYPLNNNRKPFVQDARRVVKKVETSNGIGGLVGTSYYYEGLRYGMDHKESLGFARIKVSNDATGMYDLTTYNQGAVTPKLSAQSSASDAQGLIAVTETHSGGTSDIVLSHTANTWNVVADNTDLVNSNNQRFSRKLLTTDITKRGLDNAVLYIENNSYTYDSDGRIDVQTTVSKDPNGTTLKTTTIDNDYVDFTSGSLWIKGLTSKMTVTDDVTAAAYPDSYNPAAVTRVSKWVYNNTTGVLEKEQIWNGAETVMLSETVYGNYDPFGHPRTITVKGSGTSPDFDERSTTSTYDSSGRFVIDTVNALGQHVCADYFTAADSFGSGAYPGLVKYTSALSEDCIENIGLKTSYTYDSFGRVVTTTAASNTAAPVSSTTTFMTCTEDNYAANCPNGYVAYAIKTVTEGSGEAWSYVDILGREIQRKSQGFDGSWVMVDKTYNNKGQLEQSTEPYFYGATPQYNSYEYDLRDRVIEVTQADGRVDTMAYSGGFNNTTKVTAMEVSVRDVGSSSPKNETRTEKKNALGQVLEVIDPANNSVKYRYDSAGRLVKTIDSANHEVTLSYDEFGRKTGMSDPDKGSWSYGYNGLGQLVLQTNANGDKTCIVYDLLGRMTQRVDQYGSNLADAVNDCANPGTTPKIANWVYDTATNGLGKLASTSLGTGYASDEYSETRSYDAMSRLSTVSKTIKGAVYSYSTSYDSKSRPEVITYPKPANTEGNPLAVKHIYNNLGFLTQILNAANDALYYEVEAMNARGQITVESFGSGVESARAYDSAGRLDTLLTSKSGAGYVIQNIDVDFDLIGNLTRRADAAQGFEESFSYDTLNRLTGASADFTYGVGGNSDVRVLEVSYDTLGNILTKEQTGTGAHDFAYTYGSSKPHAVTAISGSKTASYTYDANGNQLTGDGRTITYASFDLPTQIIKGSATSNISYGPDRNRYYREDIVGSTTTLTEQIDGLYERVSKTGAATQEKHYLGDFAVVTITGRSSSNAGTSSTRYLHTDHLGSLTAITDETGALVELHNYDAWGERRSLNASTMNALLGSTLWSSLTSLQTLSNTTTKGYTGHEMFDDVGIIHMNGRIYDPVIARFLQADPIIQDTTDLQAFNRYSYVQNRPLSLTDPSGFMSLDDVVDAAVKAVVGAVSLGNPAVMGTVGLYYRKEIARETGRLFIKVPELQVAANIALAIWGPVAIPLFNAAVAGCVTYQSGGSYGRILQESAVAFTVSAVAMELGVKGGFGENVLQLGAGGRLAASTVFGMAVAKAQSGEYYNDLSLALTAVAVLNWAMSPSEAAAGAQQEMAEGVQGGNSSGAATPGANSPDAAIQQDLTLDYVTQSKTSQCVPGGAAEWRIQWQLDQPSSTGGWIIQEMKIIGSSTGGLSMNTHYWEAWRVSAGSNVTDTFLGGGFDDQYRYSGSIETGSSGSISWTGSARFYPGLNLPKSFVITGRPPAGFLPMTYQNPNLPVSGATAPVNRMFSTQW